MKLRHYHPNILQWVQQSLPCLITLFLIKQTYGDIADPAAKAGKDYLKGMQLMEMVEIFGVNHHDDVPTFYPAKVNGLEELDHEGLQDLTFTVHALGKSWKVVNVRKNTVTFPDHHMTEYHDETGPVEKYRGLGVGIYTRGEIENDELSHVHLHHSGKGISGSMHTMDEAFIIKPLPLRMQDDKANHVVYRLADFPAQQQMNRYYKFINEKIGKRAKRTAHKYPKKTVEIMMVADWKMYEFYTKDVLEMYILDLANVIAGLFHDPSLEYPFDFVLVRKVIWKKDSFQATGTYDQLDKFGKWYGKWNIPDDTDPKHADIGILVSRDGCVPSGCSIEGLGNQIKCSKLSVCTARDRGLLSATSFAHEVAHTLGAHHDASAHCPTGTFIMSFNGARGGAKSVEWSPCASNSIKEGLMYGKCFDDVPTTQLTDSSYQLYGQKINSDKQCEYLYGHRWRVCTFKPNACYSLWCKNPDKMSCASKYFPALHGTPCGKGKWCIYGDCVPDGSPLPTIPAVINGNWGAWSDFTDCSKPCGVGIQWRERKCDDPEPANGGKWCDPWSKKRKPERGEYQTCNMQNCKKRKKELRPGTLFGTPMKDRMMQCKAKGYRSSMKLKFIGKCDLTCGPSKLSGSHVGYVAEGTGCVLKHMKYKKTRPGMPKPLGTCIHGVCKEYGCDDILHSNIEEDRCGVCGGNGTTCKPIKQVYKKQFKPKWSNLNEAKKILTIPKGAIDVSVIEKKPSWISLGFGFAKKGKPKIMGRTGKKKFNKKGLQMKLRLNGKSKDMIRIIGTVTEDIDIYMSNSYRKNWKGVIVRYMKSLKKPQKNRKTLWKTIKWEECSHKCGGEGIQKRHTYCIRKDDKTAVNPSACLKKKPISERPCNRVNCPGLWIVSKWTSCTKTCATGTKNRTITCQIIDSEGNQVIVDDSVCTSAKPPGPVVKACNVIKCPARWEVKSEWTPCSRSCGGGNTYRTVECWMVSETGVDGKVSDLACAQSPLEKPSDDDNCNVDSPCPHWNIIETPCSKTCGDGSQNVSVKCENEVEVFPDDKCNAKNKPDLDDPIQSCNLGPCMAGKWFQKDGICSKPCGGGEMSIVAQCQSEETGEQLDESQCDPNRKPIQLWGTCNIDECELETEWRTHNTPCSVTCGEGNITAIPYCAKEHTDEKLSEQDCDIKTKPAVVKKPCNLVTCDALIGQLEYHWIRRWQDCPVTCGEGVERTKSICIRKYGHKDVDPYYCQNQTPPQNLTRPCNYGDCPANGNVTYFWHVTDIGCGALCGQGTHEYEVACIRKKPNAPLAITHTEHCDENERPEDPKKKCKNLPACPEKYEMKMKHGICDSLCGVGQKIRMMSCKEDKQVVDFRNCESLVTKGELKPRVCHASKNCLDKDKKTSNIPPIIPMGCWEDGDSADMAPIKNKSPKQAEEDASDRHDVRIRSCALIALSKYHMVWGVDINGKCISSGDAKKHLKKKDLEATCRLSTGHKKKYFVYKFYTWN